MLPFICDGASIVILKPTLQGGWLWIGAALLVVALLCAVSASLWTPVAGAFANSEERAGGWRTVTFIGLSWFSVLCVLLGLGGMQMPVGCSTHAILVSAALPPSSEPDVRRLADKARAAATSADRAVRDLGGVRDAVLERLLPHASAELTRSLVARDVRAAIADATRYGFPEAAPAVRAQALAKFDSSAIEGIEIALLMGWHALYSGPRQSLTYLVSNRSERHGWNWVLFRHRYFGPSNVDFKTINVTTSGSPRLLQVVRTFNTADWSSLVVEALFATNGTGGTATIEIRGPAGRIGTADVRLPNQAGATILANVQFSGFPGLRDGDTVQQQTNEGTVVRRLPRPVADRITLDLRYQELRGTLDFLAGRTASCGGTDLAAQAAEWRTIFSRVQDAAPTIGGVGHHVALVSAPFGGVLILPASAGFGPTIDLDRLGLGKPPVRPITATGRVIAWSTTDAPRRYGMERLGIESDRLVGTLALVDPNVSAAVTLVPVQRGIAEHRLDRRDAGDAVGAALFRVALPDPDPQERSRRHLATVILGDPVAMGVVCGQTIPETELFLAYWHAVLDAVAAAAAPVLELSLLETAPSRAVPSIYLDAVTLQEIASARLELPLIMLAGALLIYVSMVVLAYLRALRDIGS